ncbi:MAG TPA: MFS transporter, partial [Thauera sp.]|nr:MFS transporter [Thauera sp.]
MSAAAGAVPDPGAGTDSRRALLAYGALGLPLAFAALPIYVHVPRLYAEGLGLSLALVGAVLLAARIVDALTDPLIGWANDRLPRRRLWIALALPALGAGMLGLLVPPAEAGLGWLFLLLVGVSLAWSVATIAYNAWGAEVAHTPLLRTRYVASREAFGLAGVVLAAALPAVLALGADEATGLARLAWLFLPLLAGFGLWTLWCAPAPPAHRLAAGAAGCAEGRVEGGDNVREAVAGAGQRSADRPAQATPLWAGLRATVRDAGFGRLLAVFAANGIAAAIPSATVLFFVADVLGAAQLAGLFLVLYFAAAAASLPLWVRVSQRIGKLRAWLAGMVLAVVVFAWAGLLGEGEVLAYALICVLSGLALGADLSLPPSLLADLIARSAPGRAPPPLQAGACFGWWNFVTKANLALAAGLALPLLALLGYAPGVREPGAVAALAAVYGFVPVVLKLGAIVLLWRWRAWIEPGVPS